MASECVYGNKRKELLLWWLGEFPEEGDIPVKARRVTLEDRHTQQEGPTLTNRGKTIDCICLMQEMSIVL